MEQAQTATAAKSSSEWRSRRETHEARQGGSGSQEQARMEIMKGDKRRETRQRQPTRRQRQPRAAQNGDHEGRQMKQDKAAAAAKSSPELMEIMKGDKCSKNRQQQQPRAAQNGVHEGRQTQPRINGDHEGRQMQQEQAAAAAKSSPEWRS